MGDEGYAMSGNQLVITAAAEVRQNVSPLYHVWALKDSGASWLGGDLLRICLVVGHPRVEGKIPAC